MSKKIEIQCIKCGLNIKRWPYEIAAIKHPQKYICYKCKRSKIIKQCKYCNKEIKQNAGCPNIFCSSSCAATYNNTHKSYGTRRSKLEVWIEQKMIENYPTIDIHFNRKDTINSELDIYIPSLKLAFELNGIYHYEPIHGVNTLSKIQNNDSRKFQACLENKIELCIIDTSKLIYFKEDRCVKYLDIIQSIIKTKQIRDVA